MGRPPIAYLVGTHPAVSQTFIDREVAGLRRRGVDIRPFALRPTPAAELLTEEHRRAAAETSVVLPPAPGELLAAHARAFLRSPVRWTRTLAAALRASAGGARNDLYQLFHFAEAAVVWARMEALGARHVHVHFANSAAMVGLLVARLGGPGWSWSFTMHGPTEFDDVTRYALATKVREAAFVACIGDYCRAQLMKLVEPGAWERLHVVRCGVELGAHPPPPPPGRAPGDGPLRVLCVGRLVPEKGQRILLDAVAALRAGGLDVRLTLVGDGPDRPALEHHVVALGLEADVELTGAVGQDELGAHHAVADLLCLPSFAEGIPVVLMEAMAAGLPVVATRITGVPELVEDGVSGLLVPPGRHDALAAAIAGLAADPAAARRLGAAGREAVRAGFDADVAAGRLAELLAAATSAGADELARGWRRRLARGLRAQRA